MPKEYLEIKKSELNSGKSLKEAERIGAATYNKRHPGHPMGPHTDYSAESGLSKKSISDAIDAGKPIIAPVGTFTAFAGAPRKLLDAYYEEYQKQLENGSGHDDAHRRAIRMTQHAGWHRTAKGWKQLHPDLRQKVNVRDAIKQPNGRYVIEDVDVFYPNAAKGESYTASELNQIMSNTNRMVSTGGQKPGLVEVHPNDLQKALGVQLPSHGSAVNWRNHPDKDGWVRVDLIDIDPSVIEKMKNRQLTGLSAGILRDSGGLNRRFGHVAMLGGETQALSQLPITELADVYSCSSSNQVCFSAEMPTDVSHFLKGSNMLTDSEKKHYAAMSDAYSAFAAACKSFSAGEPGGEDKVKEAKDKMEDCYSAACKELGEKGEIFKHLSGPKRNAEEGFAASPGEMPTPMPESPSATASPIEDGASPIPIGSNQEPKQGVSFSADPEAAFSALKHENDTHKQTIARLIELTNGLVGQNLQRSFAAEVDALRRDNVQLPDNAEIENMFSVCSQHPKPKEAIERLVSMLRKLPKAATPGTTGQIFSATADAPPVSARKDTASGKADYSAQIKRIEDVMGTMNFSAGEYNLGAIVSDAISKLGQ
jgi:hypothetical protein